MHLRLNALALLAALFIPPALAAEGPDLRSDQCGIHTDYDVLVDSGGIWLRHGPQAPHEVVFHDGELSLDGTMVTVSAADAARLRQMEANHAAALDRLEAGLAEPRAACDCFALLFRRSVGEEDYTLADPIDEEIEVMDAPEEEFPVGVGIPPEDYPRAR